MERFGKGQDENDAGDKNNVEGLVEKWLVFFKKNLNKITNLDQKTCKNKTLKGKLGNDNITTSLHKINKSKTQQSQAIQVLQQQQTQILALLLQRQ